MAKQTDLTVAVTGPTGTFGFGLMPLLQAEEKVSKVVGIARRPFDPSQHGWTKMEYRQGDVRDQESLTEAFTGADVVVHLAFLIVGGSADVTHAINVEGTLNTFRAAAEAGVERFVYASSVAAYGFHPDNPVGMTEEWHVRPADRLFYAQQKAELEQLLQAESAKYPEVQLYLLRPPIVLGPDAVGGKMDLPEAVASLGKRILAGVRRLPVPAVVPDIDLQLIHQDDVGQALLQCVLAAGPAGAYNIAADDVISVVDIARELGFLPLPIRGAPARAAARAISKLPFLPPQLQWVEAAAHPAIMDTTRAKTELGWKPQFTARESLEATLP